jgi:phenylpropionate dioxygenase-like ring-hydroxylating dioxygenase large terminal subunit
VEYLGLVFAYMGPPDEKPDFPKWDTTMLADVEMVPYYIDYPCNWLQICENTMDPWHTVFLHARVTDIHFGDTWGIAPVTQFYEKLHKIYATLTYRIEDKIWVRSQETISPSFSQVGAWWETGREEKYFKRASITKWTIPHDNENCMIIAWRSFGPGIDPEGHGDRSMVGKNSVDFPGQTGQEPYEYRQRHPNDYEAQVSQGPINSHAAENLGSTDKGVAYLRRKLRRSIRAIQAGEQLPEPERSGDEFLTHTHDTVLPIPVHPSEDEQLLRSVTDAVMDIVFEGDSLGGSERASFIESKLKALKNDPRFTAHCGKL